jgi:hypothetical protein
LDELDADVIPKFRDIPLNMRFTFRHVRRYGYYIDEHYILYRRPSHVDNHRYDQIKYHLYARSELVEDDTIQTPQEVYCFIEGRPGEQYTPVTINRYRSLRPSGSAPVADDATVGGGGQREQGVESRGRGLTRGRGDPRGRGLSSDAPPFGPSRRRELSTDLLTVVLPTARGLNPNAVAYIPSSRSGLSSAAPEYYPYSSRGRSGGRGL